MRNSQTITVGERVNAIGNAAGGGISVTEGILSVDSEIISVKDDDIVQSYRVMRVDAAINSGNSGGGLFDSSGELIGIVNAKYNSDRARGSHRFYGYGFFNAYGLRTFVVYRFGGESVTLQFTAEAQYFTAVK